MTLDNVMYNKRMFIGGEQFWQLCMCWQRTWDAVSIMKESVCTFIIYIYITVYHQWYLKQCTVDSMFIPNFISFLAHFFPWPSGGLLSALKDLSASHRLGSNPIRGIS